MEKIKYCQLIVYQLERDVISFGYTLARYEALMAAKLALLNAYEEFYRKAA